jgi:hypothetical protein
MKEWKVKIMTSEEIQRAIDKHYDMQQGEWLAEIALQLAILNEREAPKIPCRHQTQDGLDGLCINCGKRVGRVVLHAGTEEW